MFVQGKVSLYRLAESYIPNIANLEFLLQFLVRSMLVTVCDGSFVGNWRAFRNNVKSNILDKKIIQILITFS